MELNKIFKRQTYLIVSAIIILLIIFITISYAYFTSTKTSQGNVVVKSGDLEVAFNGSNVIDGELLPMSNLEGMSSEGYTFTVTNTGSLNTAYKVEIYVDKSVSGTYIPHQYVMVSYNGEEGRQLSEITKSVEGSTEVDNIYLIGNGEVTRKSTKDNVIRLWIKDDAPTSIIEKKIAFKIKVTSEVKSGELAGEQPICIRATRLHTEICEQTDTTQYCSVTGSVGTGNTITYGNLGTVGRLNSGDAFTCDVNGDGIYDEETERFYYVSPLYTGGTTGNETYNENIAVLQYYSNVKQENNSIVLDNNYGVAYDLSSANNHGPVTAALHLPTLSQWTNVKILSVNNNNERQIYTDTGATFTSNGLIELFKYENRAARIITFQEITYSCGQDVFNYGYLDNQICRYLLENTKYSNDKYIYGYLIESPPAESTYNRNLFGPSRSVNSGGVSVASNNGLRPVIEVFISDISY